MANTDHGHHAGAAVLNRRAGHPVCADAEIRRPLTELERDVRAGEEEIRERHRDPLA